MPSSNSQVLPCPVIDKEYSPEVGGVSVALQCANRWVPVIGTEPVPTAGDEVPLATRAAVKAGVVPVGFECITK